jgi:SAM-dependent methyltransferase
MPPVGPYYDSIAATYDHSRFGNSYGRFVDARERALVARWLRAIPPEDAVDLGCGTGRLLDFARTGVDASGPMLAQARTRCPAHRLVQADLTATGLPTSAFGGATCFHVLMHLDPATIQGVFAEAARLVRPGGTLVVDIPSEARRAWGRRPLHGWHADTSASLTTFQQWARPSWSLEEWHGLLTVPIHRVPEGLRPAFAPLDRWLGDSPLARWASYYVCRLVRR